MGSGIYKSADPPRAGARDRRGGDPLPRPRGARARVRGPQGCDARPRDLGDRRRRAAPGPGVVTRAPWRASAGRASGCWRCRGPSPSTRRRWRPPAPSPSRCGPRPTSRGSTRSCCRAARAPRSGWSPRAPACWPRCATRIDGGLPALGTCAGMIVLARATTGGAQPLVGGMDIVVRRNAFGRQVALVRGGAATCRRSGPSRWTRCSSARPGSRRPAPGVEVLARHAGHGGRGAPGRPDGDRVPPRAVGGAALPRVARGAREGPPRGGGTKRRDRVGAQ